MPIFRLLAVITTIIIAATSSAQPVTAFTYQGRLTSLGAEFDGAIDLMVTPYAQADGGSPTAPPVTLLDVPVSDGLFTAEIDFGALYGPAPAYLEIMVKDASNDGPFSLVSPRQPVTPTPKAVHALRASEVVYDAPETRTLIIPANAFFPGNELSGDWQANQVTGTFRVGGGTSFVSGDAYAHVPLPDGAVVTGIELAFFSNATSSGQVDARASLIDFDAGTFVDTAATRNFVGGAREIWDTGIVPNAGQPIDAETHSLVLKVSTNLWGPIYIRLSGARVTYTVTQPD